MAQIFLETWKLSQEAELDFNLFLLIEVVTCLKMEIALELFLWLYFEAGKRLKTWN